MDSKDSGRYQKLGGKQTKAALLCNGASSVGNEENGREDFSSPHGTSDSSCFPLQPEASIPDPNEKEASAKCETKRKKAATATAPRPPEKKPKRQTKPSIKNVHSSVKQPSEKKEMVAPRTDHVSVVLNDCTDLVVLKSAAQAKSVQNHDVFPETESVAPQMDPQNGFLEARTTSVVNGNEFHCVKSIQDFLKLLDTCEDGVSIHKAVNIVQKSISNEQITTMELTKAICDALESCVDALPILGTSTSAEFMYLLPWCLPESRQHKTFSMTLSFLLSLDENKAQNRGSEIFNALCGHLHHGLMKWMEHKQALLVGAIAAAIGHLCRAASLNKVSFHPFHKRDFGYSCFR